ncbi:DUF1566 domain-containing protein [Myxococcota bacterium]
MTTVSRTTVLALVGVALPACSEAVYVVVTVDVAPGVEERVQLSERTRRLAFGNDCWELTKSIDVDEENLVGFTFSLEGRAGDNKMVCVEARDTKGVALARGASPVRFRQKTGGETVTLALTCAEHADCDDGLFCTGEETCEAATCVRATPSCEAPHHCVTMACDEDNDRCQVTLDHAACPSGQACNQYLGCRRCDVLPFSSFCRVGELCVYSSAQPDYGECVRKAGWWCDATDCGPCNEAARCGPDCSACSPPAAACGGEDVGCVLSDCAGAADGALCTVTTEPDRSHDVCIRGVCVSPGEGVYADGVDRTGACSAGANAGEWICNLPQPTFALADTGQRDCFTPTAQVSCSDLTTCISYCGQDGQYGWDTTHTSEERYTRSLHAEGEPVVVDHVTGLEWQGCVSGLRGESCAESGVAEFRWDQANIYCEDLLWGGYSDWRLPDRFELRSIVDNGMHTVRTSDDRVFLGNLPVDLWTSSSFLNDFDPAEAGWAWYVDFNVGETHKATKSLSNTVRCVRSGGGATADPRFARTAPVADEPVVFDAVTGLTWQGCPAGQRDLSCSTFAAGSFGTWSQGMAHCQSLDWAGHADWRLPSIAELDSLVDPSRDGLLAIDTEAFPGTEVWSDPPGSFVEIYVSSTTKARGDPTEAYLINFGWGFVGAQDKELGSGLIRCLRGGQ